MRITWSSSGKDVHLDWDGRGGSQGIAEAIRAAIRAGRLALGDTLPSTRALAGDLGVARGTVSKAYALLTDEGQLRSRQGAATAVATSSPAIGTGPAPSSPSAFRTATARWHLQPGLPDLSMFPRTRWTAATRKVLNETSALGYGERAGESALRAALARYLARTRGVLADPDRIVICAGYSHGLSLLGAALRELGVREMAFEDPSLGAFRELAAAAGQRITSVPVDERGIVVSEVDSPAVVVTPAHQYPLGVTLAPDRRAELARWAQNTGAYVIEDDYDGEFRFDRQPVGALQALAPERIVYAGTASKTLAPGLRLGWLVLPRALVEPVRAAMTTAGWRGQVLDQLVLAQLLETGEYDKQVRRCRTLYRSRRDRLLATLPSALRPIGIAAGLQLVLLLPDNGPTEHTVISAARKQSVHLETLTPHWMDAAASTPGLVLGYAAPAQHAFEPTVEALLRALRSVLPGPSSRPAIR